MGSWGPGLYQDDVATDLRTTISALAKLPFDGDRLLTILIDNHAERVGLDDDGGPTFWLAVADQFERRGIECQRAFAQALSAIETGADLRDLESRGAGTTDLTKRRAVLKALASRLRLRRPSKPRPMGSAPPGFVVDVGEVLAFPTMKGEAFNPYHPNWDAARFQPDGWGALLVVARGRAFDWIPWCAISSLSVDPNRKPALQDAAAARLLHFGPQTASLCRPTRMHMRRMQMCSLGILALDPTKASAVINPKYTPAFAAINEWTFVPQARAWEDGYRGGPAVATLLAAAS